MSLPEAFLQHLRLEGYHPRSDKHSNSLGIAIARDLSTICEALGTKALAGEVVYDLNFDLHVQSATWNTDLVIGRALTPDPPENQPISRGRLVRVEIAIEIKSIMTEHRKAVKNRKRDLEAHHDHVRRYDERAISGGVFVINQAQEFKSPLRPEISRHGGNKNTPADLVEHCIREMRNVSERQATTSYGLDGKCLIVVDMDNVHLDTTRYIEHLPAPQPGDPLNYDSFLRRLCDVYERRFA